MTTDIEQQPAQQPAQQQTPLQRCYAAITASGNHRLATRSPAQLHALVSLTVHEYVANTANQDKTMDIVEQEILNHPFSLCFRALCLELDGDNEHNDKFITKWILRCLTKALGTAAAEW